MTFIFKEGNHIPYMQNYRRYTGIPAGIKFKASWNDLHCPGSRSSLVLNAEDAPPIFVFLKDINECCRRFK